MLEHLTEYVDSRSARVRIDRPRGVLQGVKILGRRSANDREYEASALREAAGLYEDAKVNVNHPKGAPEAPRDYQDRIGVIRSVEYREDDGLYADFHFNPKHALAEQLLWDAEHAPENVGFSHNVRAKLRRDGERTVVEAILKVHSVDLVADPATTRGLFEAASEDATDQGPSTATLPSEPTSDLAWDMVTLEALEAHRPDILREILEASESESARLRAELERLESLRAADARRACIDTLLAEQGLLTSRSDQAASILGPRLLESLMASPDDEAVRGMIEEHVRLLHVAPAARQGFMPHDRRPQSREQWRIEDRRAASAIEFARRITG